MPAPLEYKTVVVAVDGHWKDRPARVDRELNAMAAEGWRLVTATQGQWTQTLFFERVAPPHAVPLDRTAEPF